MDGVVGYLMENPVVLIPVLLIAAMLVYAVLKKLLKMAVILAIAGALYLAMVEYLGTGL